MIDTRLNLRRDLRKWHFSPQFIPCNRCSYLIPDYYPKYNIKCENCNQSNLVKQCKLCLEHVHDAFLDHYGICDWCNEYAASPMKDELNFHLEPCISSSYDNDEITEEIEKVANNIDYSIIHLSNGYTLNDFQYNWYLHFEEENEKSIIGLPFDPYFEAHKFDEEEILKFVSQSRSLRQLRTRWVSDFTVIWNKIESYWEIFKKQHDLFEWLYTIVFITPLVTGLLGNNLYYFSEAFDPKPLFCDDTRIYINHKYHDHVGIIGRIGYVIWNYIVLYFSLFPFGFFVVWPLSILGAFDVKIKPNRRDLAMIIALLFCI